MNSIVSERCPYSHFRIAEMNGIFYIIGGSNNFGLLNTVAAFEPNTGRWKEVKFPLMISKDF